MKTLQEFASEVVKAFEYVKVSEDRSIWRLKDNSPEWMTDLCHNAHGDMFPDDLRYEMIHRAVDALESDEADDIQFEADDYTSDLTGWLASRSDRYAYVDDAINEMGLEASSGILALIGAGQCQEKMEVLNLVRTFLENMVDEQPDGDDAE